MRGNIGGVLRRWRLAIGAAASRVTAPLAGWRSLLGPRPIVGLAVGAVVLAAIAAGVFLMLGHQAAEPRDGSVAAGVPLPTAAGRQPPDAPKDNEPADDAAIDAIARTRPTPDGRLNVPATTADAFAAIPPVRQLLALAESAEPALLERGDDGLLLPRPGADGRIPWRTYARPFDRSDDRPRVVIVVAGLGLSAAATDAAIERMPGEVGLAFVPTANDLASQLHAARRFGHETLALLPLESADFPFEDAGPEMLQSAATAAENLQRLNTALAATPASVGVLAIGGTRFARAEAAVQPVLSALAARGLLLADASGGGAALLAAEAARLEVPRVLIDFVLDETLDAPSIDARLAELEAHARRHHVAVGLARPLPLSLARIRAWAAGLEEKRLVLAPVTAVVDSQFRTETGAGR
ncbi:MAG: divergent polysaccharide deacetylase family protein [Rhodospirillales bacterium]